MVIQRINKGLAVATLLYTFTWLATVQHWIPFEKEIFIICSFLVGSIYLYRHFRSKNISQKNNLVLVTILTYLTFKSLVKFNFEGLVIFPKILLVTCSLILILEIYDRIQRQPGAPKMNGIELICFLSFFTMIVWKSLHYPGSTIASLFFHASLVGIALDLLRKRRYITAP